jgi:hypothetical protein
MSLQEKFQVTIPYSSGKDESSECWVPFNSARKPGTYGTPPKNNKVIDQEVVVKTNFLPPGMEGNNQGGMVHNEMPLSLAGASDVSADTNTPALGKGFTRRNMGGADDQYTGEHVDHFYGEVEDEAGNVGFAERNNYLDRI